MSETQNQDAPQPEPAEPAGAVSPAPEAAPAPAAAPAEEKHERLAESDLEASLSDVLPLSPIENGAPETASGENAAERKHGRRGLRRGNAGRRGNGKNAAAHSVGIVENPGDAKESLSGKFVDGYDKDKEFRRARERREKAAEAAARAEAAPQAQGWELREEPVPEALRRRHPQSNAGGNRTKLIIEPAPIPEQEKDPSVWQKFKAKILAIFGLNKKKKKKNRRGGKNRSRKGKKFNGQGDGARKENRDGNAGREFRGGNRRSRRGRGPRPGNSGARPHNGGNGNPPAAAS